ncbi:hypothetical protein [Streptomyces sp. MZ04]|uniref:hypothetical protein n=1 Tax=Streptomyces sp. MZ04 TaxID=2559236 RepID=UPI00107E8BB7|nr:hypothetical protein [Streptomyces sp. MZ04]TGB05594.1 hypothetical protein E2651_24805 [Streptomyces sp. MZ04]
MHLRQVTACPESAAYTTHRRRKGALAWQIYTCPRHRRLPHWSAPGNLRRLSNEERPSCGTVHDHRPHAEIIVTHLHGWMCASGTPSGSPEPAADDWHTHLHNARGLFAVTGQRHLLEVVDHALRLADSGAVVSIVTLLAAAETLDAQCHRR